MINQSRLKELFIYRDDGNLIRLADQGSAGKAGYKAGCKREDGYVVLNVDGKQCLLHRLVYIYHFDYTPKCIDHIDGNPSNNSIENLQDITLSQNQSKKKLQKNNTSGFVGVTWNKAYGRWTAKIKKNGKTIFLGNYKSFDGAKNSRIQAENKYFGEHTQVDREVSE